MSLVRALPLCLIACASTPAPAALAVNTPSLRAALPPPGVVLDDPRCPPGTCGTTGREARLTSNSRATAVTAIYERYLRALYDRSIEALRPLLADFVAPIQPSADSPPPNAGVSRDVALASHVRLLQAIDTGGRPFSMMYVPPTVRFHGGPNASSGLRPGDYFAVGDTSAFRRASGGMPISQGVSERVYMIVRFIDDEPRIVGIPSFILSMRP